MSAKLDHLLDEMTPQEQAEVETFAMFVLARRALSKGQMQIVTDDISSPELARLVMESGSFDWLADEEEDV